VCCSTEEAVLRKSLDRELGAGRYHYNSVSCELRVESGIPGSNVIAGLRAAGFGGKQSGEVESLEPFLRRHAGGITVAAAALLCVGGMAAVGGTSRTLLGASILVGGHRIVRRALGSLRMRGLDMSVLICVAVAGALAIGRWEEGAAVIVLFAVSPMLESYSSARTRRALRSLMSLTPETASVVLMSDNLGHLPYLSALSRMTLRIVRQNVALALCVKLAVCALAVIFNALRILAFTDAA
jgi:Cd2+/Zn2+-exporting ATPase